MPPPPPPGGGSGQSFTPSTTSISSAAFTLLTTGTGATVHLNIYQGGGFAGTLLASSPSLTITNTTGQTVQFDLASPLALTAGTVYTLRVAVDAGAITIGFANTNPYAGGSVYGNSGTVSPNNDLTFTEGIGGTSAVPEPSTWALLGGGAGLLGLTLRRQCHRARLA